jgi:hypothetical protein
MIKKMIIDRLPGGGSPRDCAIWALHRLMPRSLFRRLKLSRLREAIEEAAANESKQTTFGGRICLVAREMILLLEKLAGYRPVVSPDRLYARATPQRIRITETYCFSQKVFGELGSGAHAKPVGEIQAVTPYDGLTHFDENARRDVARQLAYLEPCAQAEALIGHLHFTNHQYTNLPELLASSNSAWSLNLQAPVRNATITKPDQLYVDGYLSVTDLTYEPRPLDAYPIQLQIELVEDEAQLSDRYSSMIGGDRRIEPEKEVSRRISERARSTHRLLVRMTVNLYLKFDAETPYSLDIAPRLKRLSLDWPVVATSRTAQAPHEFGRVSYDPIRKRFEWFDMNFELQSPDSVDGRESDKPQTKRFVCGFDIEVAHPGALYELGIMSGQIEIEVRGALLSGLCARYYDALGRQSNQDGLEMSTRLKTRYTLQLDEAFLRQQHSPHLHLYFPGVLPNEDRFNVVVTALTDRGFQVDRENLVSAPDRLKVRMIAKRDVLPQPVVLELVVVGSGFDAIREKEVGGTETFTRQIRGGELEILMRAEVSGNGEMLIKEMNELHRVLRERLPQKPV